MKLIKTKIIATIILVVSLMTLALPFVTGADVVSASSDGNPRFVDEYGLLNSSQAKTLEKRLDEISDKHNFDVVVLVVDSINRKDPRVFAADYFEENGYGRGKDNTGIILMISMSQRDFAFVTTGTKGFYAFTDAGQAYLEKLFLPQLSDGDYYGAFMTFADNVDDFLVRADNGRPYDTGNIPRMTAAEKSSARLWSVIISIIVALLAASIVIAIWQAQLKSVRKQDFAGSYIRQGSMALRVQRDIFLYRNITKVKRQESSSSGGSSGSFKSSSGSSFSGRSGKF